MISRDASADDSAPPVAADRLDVEADTIIEGQRRAATDGEHGLTPGTRLGRYVVLEEIGQGGMGLVFSAYDPELNRKVALKLLRPNQSERKRARSRLLLEAQALAKLAHPNVITVYDVGTVGERVFVAMELIEGTTLKGWLAEKPRRWDEVLEVFVPAGRGLAAAHAANLVHRDFKPDNVLIGRDGRVRVMDFGLARPVNSEVVDTDDHDDDDDEPASVGNDDDALYEPLLTQTGSIMGTPAYMAPEQHLGQPTDARSDQFSFCTSLYQALYGERPFDGDDAATLTAQKRSGKVREPPERASVPGWVRRVLLRGLAPTPEARFDNMDALLTELGKDPRVLRRKIATGVGVAAAMIGTVATADHLLRPPQTACVDIAAALPAVWNDARKAELAAGLAKVDRAFVPATASLVSSTLDAYAEAWTQMKTDACEATHLRGEQSTRLLERRDLCLQDRLDELDALAAILTEGDPIAVAHAGFAAMELQPIAQCAETEALNAEVEPPQEPAIADAVAASRRQLMRVRALTSAGLAREAIAEAQAAYARAQTIATPDGENYRPLVAEAGFRLGQAQALAFDADAGWKNLEEAHWMSSGLKHDVIAAKTAAALVPVSTQTLRRPSDGLSWARHAEATLKRVRLSGRAEAQLRFDMAQVIAGEGDRAGARESLATALELFEREPANTWWLAAVHRSLADLALADARIADAQAELGQAREIFDAAFGPAHPDAALDLALDGRIAAAMGEPDRARARLDDAVARVEDALGPSSAGLIPLLQQRAALEQSAGRHDDAIAALRRAHAIARDVWGDHPKVARALSELGDALATAGRIDEARQQQERALTLWERTRGKDNPDVAFALTSLGELDLREGKAEDAVKRLERAYKLRGGRGLDPQLFAQTQFALAQALHAMDDRARARELAAKARDAFANGKPPAPARAAAVDAWLAKVGETLPQR